jgi:predicted negative regulator of RcsB-dependent stress response
MQLQDAPATYLFKLWPWIETNKIRIACGGGIVVVAIGLISFYSWQRDQKEITAGETLSRMMMSDSRTTTAAQQAGLFMKVAGDYPGTAAGQRAILQSAAQATLGVAASLDAQGQTDSAAGVYQRVITSYSDVIVASYAKYRLAQIDERLGKWTEALNLYEDVARSNPGSQLGSEAGLRAMELKMKPSSASPATAPTAPIKLNP